MLFEANITAETLKDEDKLTEQLYIFLRNYVVGKLRYEDNDTKEDCVQDTLMVLIRKARELTPEQINTINLEQYFYNRANSYVSSIWFRKLNTHRSRYHSETMLLHKLSSDSYYNTPKTATGRSVDINGLLETIVVKNSDMYPEPTYNHIDYELIANLVEAYRLPFELEACILQEVENELTRAGYGGNIHEVECLDVDKDTLRILTLGIVDEYILHSLNRLQGENNEQNT